MKRIRWYRLKLPSSFYEFTLALEKKKMQDANSCGFLDVSDGWGKKLKYFYKNKLLISQIDSNGEEKKTFVETIENFILIFFEVNNQIYLRVEDPPRSLRDFMNNIELIAGFGFSATPIIFSREDQLNILGNHYSCKIIGFKGVGSKKEPKIVARIEVASKEEINIEEIDFIKDINFQTDHISYEVDFNFSKSQITFTSSGVVKINGSLEDDLLERIEKSF